MADMMDTTINSIMTAFVAVVLVCSAFIPTVLPMISNVADIGEDGAQYASLLGVVVTMTIVGLVIGVIRSYSNKREIAREGSR